MQIALTPRPEAAFLLQQPPEEDEPEYEYEPEQERKVVLTAASSIKPRRVRWLWDGRLALGTLGLLAGREGLGKSTVGYWIAGQVTLGLLPGEYEGKPASVLVCASEDSWEHTIVPRLIAAGADLDRVYRVEVVTSAGIHGELSLPRDLRDLDTAAKDTGAGLLLLDPLVSRLSSSLDSHKDAEVRQALEPLVAIADRARLAVLGIIHHNKSGSTDPLQLVMGSKAFTAVARSVHTVIPDPDDDTEARRLFGTPKNNLGRDDLPALAFTITGHPVETDDGTAWTGAVTWAGESVGSIRDAMQRGADNHDDRSAGSEAAGWLDDYLTSQGGTATSKAVKAAARSAGHTERAIRTARQRLHLDVEDQGYPRITYWSLPNTQPSRDASRDASRRGDVTTDMTDTTEGESPSGDGGDSRDATPHARVTTEPEGLL